MKRLMTAAFALSLMAGGAATAQDWHRGGSGAQGPQAGQPQGGRGGGGAWNGQSRGGQPQGGGRGGYGNRAAAPPAPPRQGFQQAPQQAQPNTGFVGRGQGGARRGPDRSFAPAGGDNRGFDRGYSRGGDRNYGQGGRSWRSAQRFRGPAYRYPRGYGYGAWGFGQILPSAFFASDYTLYDYWSYGLPEPPPGFRWIRVGDDALLTRGDGYILDVVTGLFW